jgi:hypothetical protein
MGMIHPSSSVSESKSSKDLLNTADKPRSPGVGSDFRLDSMQWQSRPAENRFLLCQRSEQVFQRLAFVFS